jgi:hypothetical protein
MEKLRLELDSFRPIPQCLCAVTYSCTLILTIIAQKENDYVIMFLRGLNESFANVRSQIMIMSPLPDVEKACNLLCQQERQMDESAEESKVLFNANFSEKKKLKGKNKFKDSKGGSYASKICTHYKKVGHTAETCFKKFGFPGHLKKNGSINNCVADEDNSGNSEDDSDTKKQLLVMNAFLIFHPIRRKPSWPFCRKQVTTHLTA